jgi:hypothetical protein
LTDEDAGPAGPPKDYEAIMANRKCEVCNKKFKPEANEKTCPTCNAQFSRIYPDQAAQTDSKTTTKNEGTIMSAKFIKAVKKYPKLIADGDVELDEQNIIDRLYEVVAGNVEPSEYGLPSKEAARGLLNTGDKTHKDALKRAEAAREEKEAEEEESEEEDEDEDAEEEDEEAPESAGPVSVGVVGLPRGSDSAPTPENAPAPTGEPEADKAGEAAHAEAIKAGKSETEARAAGEKAAKKVIERAPGKDGKPGPKMTYQWKMRQLSPARQMAAKLRNARDAAQDYAKEAKGWNVEGDGHKVHESKTLATLGAEAVEALSTLIDALEALPESYKPKKPTNGASETELSAGQTVYIREKVRKTYEDVLANTGAPLTVVKVAGTKIVCESKADGKITIPRKDLATQA